jgi:hypothetical protein
MRVQYLSDKRVCLVCIRFPRRGNPSYDPIDCFKLPPSLVLQYWFGSSWLVLAERQVIRFPSRMEFKEKHINTSSSTINIASASSETGTEDRINISIRNKSNQKNKKAKSKLPWNNP